MKSNTSYSNKGTRCKGFLTNGNVGDDQGDDVREHVEGVGDQGHGPGHVTHDHFDLQND